MFRGRYQHTIDPKGRLSVPAKFRDALAQYGDHAEQLIVVPNEHALEVHPLEEWQRIEEKLNSQPTFAPERKEVWYSEAYTGFYAVRLTNGAWPD